MYVRVCEEARVQARAITRANYSFISMGQMGQKEGTMKSEAIERRFLDWGVWVSAAGKGSAYAHPVYAMGEAPKWGRSFQDYNPWASVPVSALDAREVDDFIMARLDAVMQATVREVYVGASPRVDCAGRLGITTRALDQRLDRVELMWLRWKDEKQQHRVALIEDAKKFRLFPVIE